MIPAFSVVLPTLESTRKKRKFNSGESTPLSLKDINAEEERRKLREEESRKIPGRRVSFPGGTGYIAAGSVVAEQSLQSGRIKPLSSNELEKLHEYCLRMSTECRITTQNSWELKLIDYLQEVLEPTMTQARDFHKASVTIDASVKIYSNRVDSLAGEAFKVESLLTRTHAGKSKEEQVQDPDTSMAPEQSQNQTAVKVQKSQLPTLESDDSLSLRNVESQFDMDPVFKLISSKFDADGAKGLLLNNCSLRPSLEFMLLNFTRLFTEENIEKTCPTLPVKGQQVPVTIVKAVSTENAGNPDIGEAVEGGEDDDINLGELSAGIQPVVQESEDEPAAVMTSMENENVAVSNIPEQTKVEEQVQNNAAVQNDHDNDFEMGIDLADEVNASPIQRVKADEEDITAVSNHVVIQEVIPDTAIMFSTEPEECSELDPELEAMNETGANFRGFLRKLMPLFRKDNVTGKQEQMDITKTTQSTEEKKKKRLDQGLIDFSKPLPPECIAMLEIPSNPFVNVANKGKERFALENSEDPKDHKKFQSLFTVDPRIQRQRAILNGLCLQVDQHFQLSFLFQPYCHPLPEWNLKFRKQESRKKQQNPLSVQRPEGGLTGLNKAALQEELPTRTGIQQDNMNLDLSDIMMVDDGGNDSDGEIGGHPTSMVVDHTIQPQGGSMEGGVGILANGGLALVDSPSRPVVPQIYYDKVSKHVDIKKLKDCMWTKIHALFQSKRSSGSKETITFKELIDSMNQEVKATMGNAAEITISFYLISLLHIANDHGLFLESNSNLDDLIITKLNPNTA